MKHQKTKVMKTQASTNNSYAANRTVEITVWLIGIIVLALLLVSTNSTASNFQFEDEAYVDDIPFDTEMVVHLLMMPKYNLEEEAYVDDIPFNTEFIASQKHFIEAMAQEFELEDEGFVNDIPFDTQEVSVNFNYQLSLEVEFLMPEEKPVNDIPFNTCLIASKANNSSNRDVYACSQ